MASVARAQRRRQEREQAQAEAAQQKVQQVDALGQHIQGYQSGYSDGYFRALEDLRGSNVVAEVSSQIVAVMHNPEEQAIYVLDKFQHAMRPRSIEAFKAGIDKATQIHLQELGLLPAFDAPPEESEDEPAAATTEA